MNKRCVGAKKAALKLQTLTAADRRWLLSQLDRDDRHKVESALTQARRFKANAADFHQILAQLDSEERQENLLEKSLRFWDWADSTRIERITEQLSPASIAIFLDSLDKEQRSRFESELNMALKNKIQSATRQQRHKPSARVVEVVRDTVFEESNPG